MADHMLIVDFADGQHIEWSDTRLKIFKELGIRKWILLKKEEIGVAEAIHLLMNRFVIVDLNVKQPDIEEVVKELYENEGMTTR